LNHLPENFFLGTEARHLPVFQTKDLVDSRNRARSVSNDHDNRSLFTHGLDRVCKSAFSNGIKVGIRLIQNHQERIVIKCPGQGQPLALPGILTGTIIGMAQALGESAPLLMIGMVAFVVDVPGSPLDPATALPVQIYIWADSPERAFGERTAAAIMVLLGFLVLMNALAVILRKRFERRW